MSIFNLPINTVATELEWFFFGQLQRFRPAGALLRDGQRSLRTGSVTLHPIVKMAWDAVERILTLNHDPGAEKEIIF
jgi:hypothetical protein